MAEQRVERTEEREERVEVGTGGQPRPAQPERPQGDGPHGMSEGDPDSGGMLVDDADGAPRGA